MLEPVSKQSYKRKPGIVLSGAGQLNLASQYSASRLPDLCCFSVCCLIRTEHIFLVVCVSSQTRTSGYQRIRLLRYWRWISSG